VGPELAEVMVVVVVGTILDVVLQQFGSTLTRK